MVPLKSRRIISGNYFPVFIYTTTAWKFHRRRFRPTFPSSMDALKTAGCDKVFTEKASGSHRDRPQLKAALNYLREGDTLVVWKLSRLARSLTQVIKTATDINDRGIALKVLIQNIDTSTSEGRLFFHMTAAFDEFQRELIVENTRAGLAAANKRGRRGGRPRAMNEQTIKHAEAMLKDTEN